MRFETNRLMRWPCSSPKGVGGLSSGGSRLHSDFLGDKPLATGQAGRPCNVRLQKSYAVARGFTLIELIVILIIVGVLAVAAIPRFFDRQSFDARSFYDQALSMVRYGQKVAISQHTNVFFNANAASKTMCLTYVADAGCANATGVPNPADGNKFSKTAPDGVTLSASTSFSFSALGKPIPDAAVSFGVVGDGMTRTITVERETGYVH